MLSPDQWEGWQGREFFAIDATKILNDALQGDSPRIICKGITQRVPDTVYPLWFPTPKGRAIHPKGHWRPDHGVLAELVSRVTEMRSRRWNAETKRLARWPENWEKLIRAAYAPWPSFYSLSEGWADLIAAGASWIQELEPEADWSISDAKEKWGQLSLYWSGDLSDAGKEILDVMEHVSAFICEVCGGPGQIRRGGWLTCLCDEHHEDRSWRDWVR